MKQAKTNRKPHTCRRFLMLPVIFLLLLNGRGVSAGVNEPKVRVNKFKRVTYSTQPSYALHEIEDITEKKDGKATLSNIKQDNTVINIPANSKINVRLGTFCMDARYSYPNAKQPMIFSYERVDMPLFTEVMTYLFDHPEVRQILAQHLVWNLSSNKRKKFSELRQDEQELLLEIVPDAQTIVDSYEYNRNISVNAFDFGKEPPKKIVAQPIPGTNLYGKVLKTRAAEAIDIVIYNPTDADEFLPFFTEEGIFSVVPAGWAMLVKAGGLSFNLLAGKMDIKDGIVKTGPDAGAVIATKEGGICILEPASELTLDQLDELMEQQKPPQDSTRSLWISEACADEGVDPEWLDGKLDEVLDALPRIKDRSALPQRMGTKYFESFLNYGQSGRKG